MRPPGIQRKPSISSDRSVLGVTVNDSSFRTPSTNTSALPAKKTPPMCQCGRRAKRRMSQTPGPNMGRIFFSCPQRSYKSSDGKKTGCRFFKWEEIFTTKTNEGGYSPHITDTSKLPATQTTGLPLFSL
eukprot:GHVO01045955.1.p2 GENE.GHVO01045955.1~~GHVO01045955.1.p2  ORF type:complete len:129 (-),score=10.79 GHVO01045955.1:103-489(-)